MAARRQGIVVLLAFSLGALVVMLFSGFEVGIRHVPPDAVQVSLSYIESGRVLLSRDITDAPTVAGAYAVAINLPAPDDLERSAVFHCNLNDPGTLTQYTIRFTRQGMTILVVTRANVCGASWGWTLASGGLPGDFRSDHREAMIDYVMSVLPGATMSGYLPPTP
jgi:hypothetical protein